MTVRQTAEVLDLMQVSAALWRGALAGMGLGLVMGLLLGTPSARADTDLPTKFSNIGTVGNTRHNLTQRQVALGGAFTAVIFGLAAQQTLGNLFAGIVLLSARPFRVGERVRMQGGPLAGTVEGVVSSLGLLYTVLANGADQVMVPNSVVLNVAVVPLREPDGLDLVARLESGTTPEDVQRLLDQRITVPLRERVRVSVESLDADAVVMRISAVPERPHDGPTLAGEVLDAMRERTAATDQG